MNKEEMVLAAMAASGGADHTPVQMQKLLFLLDKQISTAFGGPHFNFQPYDYGPFDRHVYVTLEALAMKGQVEISTKENLRTRTFRLTPTGLDAGVKSLATLPAQIETYVKDLSAYVRKLSFAELVSAVYRAYPEMKANSIFKG